MSAGAFLSLFGLTDAAVAQSEPSTPNTIPEGVPLAVSTPGPFKLGSTPPMPDPQTQPAHAQAMIANAQTVTSVGRTVGSYTVSQTGAATYTIPLWTPPGVRGIQPHMALVYNSQQGEGYVGPGWALAGLSAIARCNGTTAQDGAAYAVTLVTTDRLCLDGQRLRVTSSGGLSSYGQPGTTYQKEFADFANVTASSASAGNGPSYFTVQGKDGLTYEYGNPHDPQGVATNAQAFPGSSATPYAWALDKVSDGFGNYMEIHYTSAYGSLYPSSINYTFTTSNGNLGYSVAFAYSNLLTGPKVRYVNGAAIQQPYMLSTITVSSGSTTVHVYNLSYSASTTTGRGLLKTIQECAGSSGTDCLQPTTITYQYGTEGISNPATASSVSASDPSSPVYAVDVNGDGRADLVYATVSGTNRHWWVLFGGASGLGSPVDTGIIVPAGTPVLADDFLGLGHVQLLAPSGGTWELYQWTGSAFSAGATSATYTSGYQYAAADVSGDGLADLVWATSSNVYTQVNTGGSGVFSTSSTLAFQMSGALTGTISRLAGDHSFSNSAVQTIDFNGDGRGDILLYTTGGQIAYLVAAGYPTTPLLSYGYEYGGTQVVPVNWNADACTDLYDYHAAIVLVSGCNLGALTTVSVGQTGNTQAVAVDWDGDGQQDLIVYSGSGWTAYLSAGGGAAKSSASASLTPTSPLVVLDEDGDTLHDLVYVVPGSGAIYYGLHSGAGQQPDLATSFTDGYGMSVNPSYTAIAQGNYTAATGAIYPDPDYVAPVVVASGMTASDGTGGTYGQTYYYYYLLKNLQGRGLDGFAKQQIYDSRTQATDNRIFQQIYPYTGMMVSDEVDQSDGNTLTNVSNVSAEETLITTANNTQEFLYFSKVQTTAFGVNVGGSEDGQIITHTSTTYQSPDSYGNFATIATTVTDQDPNSPWNGATYQTTTAQTYTENASTWCIGLPLTTTITNQVYGQSSSSTRSIQWSNNANTCSVTGNTTMPSTTALTVATVYGTDSCGNVNSVQVTGNTPSGNAMAARTTGTNFGARCQIPESITNPMGEVTTITNRYDLGIRQTQSDPNGAKTTWATDDFGRVTQVTNPDGTYSTFTRNYCNSGNSYCGTGDFRWTVTESDYNPQGSAENSFAYIYYDGFDRQRVKQVYNLASSVTDYYQFYDQMGRIAEKIVPFSTGAEDYHLYTYDLLNRMIKDASYTQSGSPVRQTSYVYVGRETQTTDPDGNTVGQYLTALGQLGRVVDPSPGGTTNYTYDNFGNLVTLAYPTGTPQTFTYDLNGNMTGRADDDRGTWIFARDSLGELFSETDAKHKATGFSYDALGRMTSRSETEGTSSWTWGSTSTQTSTNHNYDRIVAMAGPDGYQEADAYDTLGRPASATYTEDTTYTASFTYDANTQQLGTVTYPASTGSTPLKVTYGYTNGILNKVTDANAGTVYWQMAQQDAWGNASQEVLGNNVQVNSTYDPLLNILTARTSGTASSYNNQQNLQFQFDPAGNLSDRIDVNQSNLDEHFNYDALNRFQSSTLAGSTNLSAVVSATGNVTSRSDVGSYTYPSSSPHGVTGTSNGWSFGYDGNGNMTSDRGTTVTWYSYNLPKQFSNGSASSTFAYTPNRNYWQQLAIYSNGQENTYYIGGLMQKVMGNTVTDYRHYIRVGNETIVIDRSTGSNSNTYYLTRDHLGSSSVVTNSSGTVVLNESFATFGARRGSNWTSTPTSGDYTEISVTTREGFTGQTMLDNFGLIHMNGRVYDPAIGRFLSSDPTGIDITDSQSANPYSYVGNRPLTFTDPTGFDVCVPDMQFVPTSGTDPDGIPYIGGHDQPTGMVHCFGAPTPLAPPTMQSGTSPAPPAPPPIKTPKPDAPQVPNPCPGSVPGSSPPPGAQDSSNGITFKDLNTPPGSVTVTAPDGTSFSAPPYANFQSAYNAGVADGANPFALRNDFGQWGTFDFQRNGSTFISSYTNASNYAVGIGLAGSGIPKQIAFDVAQLYALLQSANAGSSSQLDWWKRGWNAASSCPKPSSQTK